MENKLFIDEEKGVIHSVDCEKKKHDEDGYLHDESDDYPYIVDGCYYCGRCHKAL